MADPTRPQRDSTPQLEVRIGDLEQRLDAMSSEIVTKRLVVADPDGFERVVITNETDSFYCGAVTVHSRDEKSTFATLSADASDMDASAGLFILGAGDGALSVGYGRADGVESASVTVDHRHRFGAVFLTEDGVHDNNPDDAVARLAACVDSLRDSIAGLEDLVDAALREKGSTA